MVSVRAIATHDGIIWQLFSKHLLQAVWMIMYIFSLTSRAVYQQSLRIFTDIIFVRYTYKEIWKHVSQRIISDFFPAFHVPREFNEDSSTY
jgi:hypothetical protein